MWYICAVKNKIFFSDSQIKSWSRTVRSERWSRRSQRWWRSVRGSPTWPLDLRCLSIWTSYSALSVTCWIHEHWCTSVWRNEDFYYYFLNHRAKWQMTNLSTASHVQLKNKPLGGAFSHTDGAKLSFKRLISAALDVKRNTELTDQLQMQQQRKAQHQQVQTMERWWKENLVLGSGFFFIHSRDKRVNETFPNSHKCFVLTELDLSTRLWRDYTPEKRSSVLFWSIPCYLKVTCSLQIQLFTDRV